MSDMYEKCPLTVAGFSLWPFRELGTVVIGSDGRCICTKEGKCINVDKRDGMRCSLAELKQLNNEASRRRAWQSGGEDW